MVNNFEYIKQHMHFLNEKSFYFIQILRRKKENPEQDSYSRPIESFYAYSVEQFERLMPHIIEKCEEHRARAYIKMNCLDAESVMLAQIADITQIIRKHDWHSMASTLNSACGQCGKQDGNEKLYLVDLDDDYADRVEEIKEFIDNLEPIKYREYDEYGHTMREKISKIKMEVPTQHGIHLITTGFQIPEFKQAYEKKIDVHEDGNTLLYFPNSCDDIIYFDKELKKGDRVEISGYADIWNGTKYTFDRYDTSYENKVVCVVIRDSDNLELRFQLQYVKRIK